MTLGRDSDVEFLFSWGDVALECSPPCLIWTWERGTGRWVPSVHSCHVHPSPGGHVDEIPDEVVVVVMVGMLQVLLLQVLLPYSTFASSLNSS